MSKAKELFDRVQSRAVANNQANFEAAIGSDEPLCICLRCGHPGTATEFTFPTGADDYFSACPRCHASEEEITDLRA